MGVGKTITYPKVCYLSVHLHAKGKNKSFSINIYYIKYSTTISHNVICKIVPLILDQTVYIIRLQLKSASGKKYA